LSLITIHPQIITFQKSWLTSDNSLQGIDSIIIFHNHKLAKWEKTLLELVCQYFNCLALRKPKTINIIGYRDDRFMAHHYLMFLHKVIEGSVNYHLKLHNK